LKPSREYIEEIYGLPLEEEEKEPGLQDRLGQAFAPEPNSEPEGESPDEGNLDLSEKTVNFRAIPQRVITWNGLKFGVTHLPGWVRFPSSAHGEVSVSLSWAYKKYSITMRCAGALAEQLAKI